ncbi:MAG: penicillin-binding transpeptidase domain-containing protein [Oscillospiraceae bacterium]|jgi:penicillin-binding protein 2
MENKTIRRRAFFFVLALLFSLLCFFAALYQMQIVHGAEAFAQSNKKITNSETVEAARGEIRDRNGVVLASDKARYDVTLTPSLMGDTSAQNSQILSLTRLCEKNQLMYQDGLPLSFSAPFADRSGELTEAQTARFRQYAKALGLGSADGALLARLRKEYQIDDSYSDKDARKIAGVRYELDLRSREVTQTAYIFAENVNTDFIADVKEAGYFGANIKTSAVRTYHTAYAAHLLGRVAAIDKDQWPDYQAAGYPMNALVGKDGAEYAFESYLRGVSGIRLADTNASGKIVNESYAVAPQPGKNVYLTLDIRLQQTAEDALSQFISSRRGAEGGAAVVMDVKNGEVLAMASYPTFDLSQYAAQYTALSQDETKPLLNRATMGVYAPGSTFKMVTAVGALEENIITPNTLITDTGRYTYYPDYQPMCWIYRQHRQTHGTINVSKALEVSCNVFFYDIGRRLTIESLDRYAHTFGLGRSTGIELAEKKGILAGPEYSASLGSTWMPGSTLAAAIGQSDNAFTPLQICNYIATLANGGTRYQAHLFRQATSYDDARVEDRFETKAEDTLNLSDSTLEAVKKGMLAVTQNGSAAKYFSHFGIAVCAKTGSAQVGSSSESNAVFVCFAPYDDPEIAITLVVEKGGSGYELGAVARKILDTYFQDKDASADPAAEQEILP